MYEGVSTRRGAQRGGRGVHTAVHHQPLATLTVPGAQAGGHAWTSIGFSRTYTAMWYWLSGWCPPKRKEFTLKYRVHK